MGTSILIFRRRENDKLDINGWYPDLCEFEPSYSPMDYLVDDIGDYFAVAFG